ncbi:MAG: hypothetical protein JKY98_10010, partial [Gammaproteobacteria bacterium]|nr:hypothetical protein [Gammaproteobacteria bacterium]
MSIQSHGGPANMKTINKNLVIPVFTSILLALGSTSSHSQEPIRIAFMDPLSGSFASVGTSGLKIMQFSADYLFNSKGGILGGRMIE